MNTYGLTEYHIEYTKKKIEFNKSYISGNGVQIDDQIIPFADFVANSYNNSDRYVAELQHRAWSIYDYALENNLKNIFITLTLPSEWHSQIRKNPQSKKDKTLIFNKKFGGRKYITKLNGYKLLNAHVKQNIPFVEPIFDFSQTIDKYTPRNASKELSNMFKKLRDDRAYKSIQKDDRCYFRVTEPHLDGTPHLHISLFVPFDSVDKIVNSVYRLFPAPASKVETDIISPVKYLMKYVLKTLDDLRDSDELSNLTYWYLYHGISRFYTSRTFAPLEVYRKLNGSYSLIDLTKEFTNNEIQIYTCTSTNKILYIENEFGSIYSHKPINYHDKKDNIEEKPYLEAHYKPLSTKDMSNYEKMTFNDKTYIVEHTKIKTTIYKPKPYQMHDLDLYHYFYSLDIDTIDDKHYLYTKNLMIERGLLNGTKHHLDDIQNCIQFFEREVF